jgi:Zn-dependent protease with chaperone function
MNKRSLAIQAIAVFLALALSTTELWSAISGPTLPNPGNPGVSKAQQEQMGQKAMAQVYQQMPVLPDSSPVTQYVQQLGRRLVAVIPAEYSWPYQFHVVQQKEINAFALPGGPIFINLGTITAADNEAELAGVMSHEMSHVYMQHSVKQMKKDQGPNILAGLGQILGSMMGGIGGAVASIGGQMVGGMLSMKYSRADEAQADAVGAIIMYKAGYDPHYLAKFFQKLQQEGGSPPQFLSDHPNPGNRMEAIDKEVANWPPKNYMVSSPQFVQAKQEAERVTAYTAQQIAQGAKNGEWARMNQQHGAAARNLPASAPAATTSGNSGALANVSYSQVQPSSRFAQTQNNVYSISYPNNWRVYSAPDNSGGMTIAPPAGMAQSAVAYGVVINTGQDPNASSLDQATSDVINSMQQENAGLKTMGKPQVITVNGVQARSVDMTGTSPVQENGRPLAERDWLVTLPMPQGQGGVLYMVFVAPEKDFNALRPTFVQMLRTVHLR